MWWWKILASRHLGKPGSRGLRWPGSLALVAVILATTIFSVKQQDISGRKCSRRVKKLATCKSPGILRRLSVPAGTGFRQERPTRTHRRSQELILLDRWPVAKSELLQFIIHSGYTSKLWTMWAREQGIKTLKTE